MPLRSQPIDMTLPAFGIAVAESVHGPDFSMTPRSDPFHKLLLLVRGSVRLIGPDGSVRPLRPFWVATIPSRTPHVLEDERPATILLLALSPSFVEEVGARAALWKAIVTRAPMLLDHETHAQITAGYRAILHRQLATGDPRDPRHELLVRHHADRILASVAANDPVRRSMRSDARVRAVLERIAAEPFVQGSREDAAAHAGLSVRRFSDLQREITGVPFARWLTAERVRYSARLLDEAGYSVSAAAFASGFASIATYYRAFRNELGCPPGRWADR